MKIDVNVNQYVIAINNNLNIEKKIHLSKLKEEK